MDHSEKKLTSSISDIGRAVEWLSSIVEYRTADSGSSAGEIPEELCFPQPLEEDSPLKIMNDLIHEDKVAAMLIYVAHWYPEKLIPLHKLKETDSVVKLQVGGIESDGRFIPTLQTLLFLLSGNDRELQVQYYAWFTLVSERFRRFDLEYISIPGKDSIYHKDRIITSFDQLIGMCKWKKFY